MFNSIFNFSLNRNLIQAYQRYIYENTYSDNNMSEKSIKNLYESYTNNNLAQTVLSVVSVSAFNRETGGLNKSTFKIYFTNEENIQKLYGDYSFGIFDHLKNAIYIGETDRKSTIIHEHAHQMSDILFKNNDANPYITLEQALSYNKAIFLTLKSIGKKYGAINDDYLKYFGSNKFFANELIDSLEISCVCELPYVSKKSTAMVPYQSNLQIALISSDESKSLISLDDMNYIEPIEILSHMDQNVLELLTSSKLNELHFVVDKTNYKFNDLMPSIELFKEKINNQEVQENIEFKKYYISKYNSFFDIEEEYNYFEYRNKYIKEGYSLEDKKQCPVEIAQEFQKFLCIFKTYEDLDINSEVIASFFEMSIDSNVEVIFPNLYKYYQEEIFPAKEAYYLANTNQCPNDYNDIVELIGIHQ